MAQESKRMSIFQFKLQGHIPGKKNLLRRSKNGGMFRDEDISVQINLLTLQAKRQWIGRARLDVPRAHFMFYVMDQRSDLDNKLTTILDCLKAAGVIVNDNIKHGPRPVTYDWAESDWEGVVITLGAPEAITVVKEYLGMKR
jgi:hypothetical protein